MTIIETLQDDLNTSILRLEHKLFMSSHGGMEGIDNMSLRMMPWASLLDGYLKNYEN